MPRLTGYLLFGLLVGPYLGNVITEGMARQLQLVTGIATTLIAFIAGLTLNLERLERRVAGAGLTTVITLADCDDRARRARLAGVAVAADCAGRNGHCRSWRSSRSSSSSSSASLRR